MFVRILVCILFICVGVFFISCEKEDVELAKAIAYRDYCISLKKSAMSIQNLLENIKEIYEEDVLNEEYRKLKPARRHLFSPIVKPIEYIIKEFEEIEYKGKEFLIDKMEERGIVGSGQGSTPREVLVEMDEE